MRALVLALVSAHYLHTAGDHARAMLQTCEQLAAGLGAAAKAAATVIAGGGDRAPATTPTPSASPSTALSVGNAPLGLWVGERFLGERFARPTNLGGSEG